MPWAQVVHMAHVSHFAPVVQELPWIPWDQVFPTAPVIPIPPATKLRYPLSFEVKNKPLVFPPLKTICALI